MGKYEPKTKPSEDSVDDFLSKIQDETKRADCQRLLELFREITGEQGQLWGGAMVGFGKYTSKTGEWFSVGFSPRAQNLTLYLSAGFAEYADFHGYDPGPFLNKLGKFGTGKSCLYVKRLSDVDENVLRNLVKAGWSAINGRTI